MQKNGPNMLEIRAHVRKIRAVFVENPGVSAENPGASVENPGACAENPGVSVENPGVSAENPSRLVENPGRLCGKSEVCGVETQGALVEILGGCVGFIRAGAGYPGGAVRHPSALEVSGVESKYSAINHALPELSSKQHLQNSGHFEAN